MPLDLWDFCSQIVPLGPVIRTVNCMEEEDILLPGEG